MLVNLLDFFVVVVRERMVLMVFVEMVLGMRVPVVAVV